MVTVVDNYVQFRFYRPQAARVFLAGDFNNWKTNETHMVHCDDGTWIAAINLPPGSYRFRYWADGQWFCDYAAFGVEPGPFGLDSVVRIPLAHAS